MGSTGPAYPVYIQQANYKPAYVDTVAVLVKTDQKASIRVSVLNRHPEVGWKAKFNFSGFGPSTF